MSWAERAHVQLSHARPWVGGGQSPTVSPWEAECLVQRMWKMVTTQTTYDGLAQHRFLLYVLGPLVVYVTGGARLRGDWSTASHTPVGLAPDPKPVREAIVQAYAAQALAWRGVFSVHTHAVGKDYVAQGWALTRSPSGTGSQVSLSGLVGLLVGLEEGV